MNTSRLIDYMLEEFDADYQYAKLSADYRRAHGHGVSFYNGKRLTEEEQRIDYARRHAEETLHTRWAIEDVLDLGTEQITRLYRATRALRRWYNDTEWERLPSEELIIRLNNYIIG